MMMMSIRGSGLAATSMQALATASRYRAMRSLLDRIALRFILALRGGGATTPPPRVCWFIGPLGARRRRDACRATGRVGLVYI